MKKFSLCLFLLIAVALTGTPVLADGKKDKKESKEDKKVTKYIENMQHRYLSYQWKRYMKALSKHKKALRKFVLKYDKNKNYKMDKKELDVAVKDFRKHFTHHFKAMAKYIRQDPKTWKKKFANWLKEQAKKKAEEAKKKAVKDKK